MGRFPVSLLLSIAYAHFRPIFKYKDSSPCGFYV
nr:MAG TPA: hypothetical protein [Caudoviricetes sp.]